MHNAMKALEDCRKWADANLDNVESTADVEKVGGILLAARALERHIGQKRTAPVAETEAEEENELVARIEDELKGAEDYYKLWRQDNAPELKGMSAQEFKHADHWIRKARESGGVPVEQLQDAITPAVKYRASHRLA